MVVLSDSKSCWMVQSVCNDRGVCADLAFLPTLTLQSHPIGLLRLQKFLANRSCNLRWSGQPSQVSIHSSGSSIAHTRKFGSKPCGTVRYTSTVGLLITASATRNCRHNSVRSAGVSGVAGQQASRTSRPLSVVQLQRSQLPVSFRLLQKVQWRSVCIEAW